MVDMAVMLGAPERAARVQMEEVLAFEINLAKVCLDTVLYLKWYFNIFIGQLFVQ